MPPLIPDIRKMPPLGCFGVKINKFLNKITNKNY
jgi:hypothetical protein